MAMKKLNPFQKKLARWCNNLSGFVLKVIVLSALAATVCGLWILLHLEFGGTSSTRLKIVFGCFFLLYYLVVCFHVFSSEFTWRWYLPEIQAQEAKEVIKICPEYAKRIGELIQESYTQDDGCELKEALKKFKVLASKEQYLVQMPDKIEKLKTEIAALEKELGMK